MERRDFLKKAAATAAAFVVGERMVSSIDNEQDDLTDAERIQQNTEFIGILGEVIQLVHNTALERDLDLLNSQNEIRRAIGLPEIGNPTENEGTGFQARSWVKDLPTV